MKEDLIITDPVNGKEDKKKSSTPPKINFMSFVKQGVDFNTINYYINDRGVPKENVYFDKESIEKEIDSGELQGVDASKKQEFLDKVQRAYIDFQSYQYNKDFADNYVGGYVNNAYNRFYDKPIKKEDLHESKNYYVPNMKGDLFAALEQEEIIEATKNQYIDEKGRLNSIGSKTWDDVAGKFWNKSFFNFDSGTDPLLTKGEFTLTSPFAKNKQFVLATNEEYFSTQPSWKRRAEKEGKKITDLIQEAGVDPNAIYIDENGVGIYKELEGNQDVGGRSIRSIWGPRTVENDNVISEIGQSLNDVLVGGLKGGLTFAELTNYGLSATGIRSEYKPYYGHNNWLNSRLSKKTREESIGPFDNATNFVKSFTDGIGQIGLAMLTGGAGTAGSKVGAKLASRSLSSNAVKSYFSNNVMGRSMAYGYNMGYAMQAGYEGARSAGLSHSEALALEPLYGAVLYATERLTGGAFIPNVLKGNISRKAVQDIIKKDIAKLSSGQINDKIIDNTKIGIISKLLKLFNSSKNRLASLGNKKGAFAKGQAEGIQESLEEVGGIFIEEGFNEYDKIFNDAEKEKFKNDYNSIIERLKTAYVMGTATGTFVAATQNKLSKRAPNIDRSFDESLENSKNYYLADLVAKGKEGVALDAAQRLWKEGNFAPSGMTITGDIINKGDNKESANDYLYKAFKSQVKLVKDIYSSLNSNTNIKFSENAFKDLNTEQKSYVVSKLLSNPNIDADVVNSIFEEGVSGIMDMGKSVLEAANYLQTQSDSDKEVVMKAPDSNDQQMVKGSNGNYIPYNAEKHIILKDFDFDSSISDNVKEYIGLVIEKKNLEEASGDVEEPVFPKDNVVFNEQDIIGFEEDVIAQNVVKDQSGDKEDANIDEDEASFYFKEVYKSVFSPLNNPYSPVKNNNTYIDGDQKKPVGRKNRLIDSFKPLIKTKKGKIKEANYDTGIFRIETSDGIFLVPIDKVYHQDIDIKTKGYLSYLNAKIGNIESILTDSEKNISGKILSIDDNNRSTKNIQNGKRAEQILYESLLQAIGIQPDFAPSLHAQSKILKSYLAIEKYSNEKKDTFAKSLNDKARNIYQNILVVGAINDTQLDELLLIGDSGYISSDILNNLIPIVDSYLKESLLVINNSGYLKNPIPIEDMNNIGVEDILGKLSAPTLLNEGLSEESIASFNNIISYAENVNNKFKGFKQTEFSNQSLFSLKDLRNRFYLADVNFDHIPDKIKEYEVLAKNKEDVFGQLDIKELKKLLDRLTFNRIFALSEAKVNPLLVKKIKQPIGIVKDLTQLTNKDHIIIDKYIHDALQRVESLISKYENLSHNLIKRDNQIFEDYVERSSFQLAEILMDSDISIDIKEKVMAHLESIGSSEKIVDKYISLAKAEEEFTTSIQISKQKDILKKVYNSDVKKLKSDFNSSSPSIGRYLSTIFALPRYKFYRAYENVSNKNLSLEQELAVYQGVAILNANKLLFNFNNIDQDNEEFNSIVVTGPDASGKNTKVIPNIINVVKELNNYVDRDISEMSANKFLKDSNFSEHIVIIKDIHNVNSDVLKQIKQRASKENADRLLSGINPLKIIYSANEALINKTSGDFHLNPLTLRFPNTFVQNAELENKLRESILKGLSSLYIDNSIYSTKKDGDVTFKQGSFIYSNEEKIVDAFISEYEKSKVSNKKVILSVDDTLKGEVKNILTEKGLDADQLESDEVLIGHDNNDANIIFVVGNINSINYNKDILRTISGGKDFVGVLQKGEFKNNYGKLFEFSKKEDITSSNITENISKNFEDIQDGVPTDSESDVFNETAIVNKDIAYIKDKSQVTEYIENLKERLSSKNILIISIDENNLTDDLATSLFDYTTDDGIKFSVQLTSDGNEITESEAKKIIAQEYNKAKINALRIEANKNTLPDNVESQLDEIMNAIYSAKKSIAENNNIPTLYKSIEEDDSFLDNINGDTIYEIKLSNDQVYLEDLENKISDINKRIDSFIISTSNIEGYAANNIIKASLFNINKDKEIILTEINKLKTLSDNIKNKAKAYLDRQLSILKTNKGADNINIDSKKGIIIIEKSGKEIEKIAIVRETEGDEGVLIDAINTVVRENKRISKIDISVDDLFNKGHFILHSHAINGKGLSKDQVDFKSRRKREVLKNINSLLKIKYGDDFNLLERVNTSPENNPGNLAIKAEEIIPNGRFKISYYTEGEYEHALMSNDFTSNFNDDIFVLEVFNDNESIDIAVFRNSDNKNQESPISNNLSNDKDLFDILQSIKENGRLEFKEGKKLMISYPITPKYRSNIGSIKDNEGNIISKPLSEVRDELASKGIAVSEPFIITISEKQRNQFISKGVRKMADAFHHFENDFRNLSGSTIVYMSNTLTDGELNKEINNALESLRSNPFDLEASEVLFGRHSFKLLKNSPLKSSDYRQALLSELGQVEITKDNISDYTFTKDNGIESKEWNGDESSFEEGGNRGKLDYFVYHRSFSNHMQKLTQEENEFGGVNFKYGLAKLINDTLDHYIDSSEGLTKRKISKSNPDIIKRIGENNLDHFIKLYNSFKRNYDKYNTPTPLKEKEAEGRNISYYPSFKSDIAKDMLLYINLFDAENFFNDNQNKIEFNPSVNQENIGLPLSKVASIPSANIEDFLLIDINDVPLPSFLLSVNSLKSVNNDSSFKVVSESYDFFEGFSGNGNDIYLNTYHEGVDFSKTKDEAIGEIRNILGDNVVVDFDKFDQNSGELGRFSRGVITLNTKDGFVDSTTPRHEVIHAAKYFVKTNLWDKILSEAKKLASDNGLNTFNWNERDTEEYLARYYENNYIDYVNSVKYNYLPSKNKVYKLVDSLFSFIRDIYSRIKNKGYISKFFNNLEKGFFINKTQINDYSSDVEYKKTDSANKYLKLEEVFGGKGRLKTVSDFINRKIYHQLYKINFTESGGLEKPTNLKEARDKILNILNNIVENNRDIQATKYSSGVEEQVFIARALTENEGDALDAIIMFGLPFDQTNTIDLDIWQESDNIEKAKNWAEVEANKNSLKLSEEAKAHLAYTPLYEYKDGAFAPTKSNIDVKIAEGVLIEVSKRARSINSSFKTKDIIDAIKYEIKVLGEDSLLGNTARSIYEHLFNKSIGSSLSGKLEFINRHLNKENAMDYSKIFSKALTDIVVYIKSIDIRSFVDINIGKNGDTINSESGFYNKNSKGNINDIIKSRLFDIDTSSGYFSVKSDVFKNLDKQFFSIGKEGIFKGVDKIISFSVNEGVLSGTYETKEKPKAIQASVSLLRNLGFDVNLKNFTNSFNKVSSDRVATALARHYSSVAALGVSQNIKSKSISNAKDISEIVFATDNLSGNYDIAESVKEKLSDVYSPTAFFEDTLFFINNFIQPFNANDISIYDHKGDIKNRKQLINTQRQLKLLIEDILAGKEEFNTGKYINSFVSGKAKLLDTPIINSIISGYNGKSFDQLSKLEHYKVAIDELFLKPLVKSKRKRNVELSLYPIARADKPTFYLHTIKGAKSDIIYESLNSKKTISAIKNIENYYRHSFSNTVERLNDAGARIIADSISQQIEEVELFLRSQGLRISKNKGLFEGIDFISTNEGFFLNPKLKKILIHGIDLKNELNDFANDLIANGYDKLPNYISGDNSDVINKAGVVNKNIETFFLTYKFNNFDLSLLEMGNPLQYKDNTTLYKRSPLLQTSHYVADTDNIYGLEDDINIVVIEDEGIESQINSSQFLNILKDNGQNISFDAQDGLGFQTPLHWRLEQASFGSMIKTSAQRKNIYGYTNPKDQTSVYIKNSWARISNELLFDYGDSLNEGKLSKLLVNMLGGYESPIYKKLKDIREAKRVELRDGYAYYKWLKQENDWDELYDWYIKERLTNPPISKYHTGLATFKSGSKLFNKYINKINADNILREEPLKTKHYGVVLDLSQDVKNTNIPSPTQQNYILSNLSDNYINAEQIHRLLSQLSDSGLKEITQEINDIEKDKDKTSYFKDILSDVLAREGKVSNKYLFATDKNISVNYPLISSDLLGAVSKIIKNRTTDFNIRGTRASVMGSTGIIKVWDIKDKSGRNRVFNTSEMIKKGFIDVMSDGTLSINKKNTKGLNIDKRDLSFSRIMEDGKEISGEKLERLFSLLERPNDNSSLIDLFVEENNVTVSPMEILLPNFYKSEFDIDDDINISDVDVSYFKSKGLSDAEAESKFNSFNNSLNVIATRIPTTGFNSMQSARIVGFYESQHNTIIVPSEALFVSGADNDGDMITVQFQDVNKNGVAHSVKNDLFNIKKQILENPKNIIGLMSPIDFSDLATKANNLSNSKGFDYDNNLSSVVNGIDKNQAGKKMIGVFVKFAETYSYMNYLANLRVYSGDFQKEVRILGKSYKNILNNRPDGKYVYKMIEDVANLSLDNAKEAALGKLNINLNTSNAYMAAMYLGISEDDILDIMTSDIAFKLSESVKNSNSLYNKGRKGLKSIIKDELAEDIDLDKALSSISDFNGLDKDYILKTIYVLDSIGEEIGKARDVLNVLGGPSGDLQKHEFSTKRLLKALNIKSKSIKEGIEVLSDKLKGIIANAKPSIRWMEKNENKFFNPKYFLALPHVQSAIDAYIYDYNLRGEIFLSYHPSVVNIFNDITSQKSYLWNNKTPYNKMINGFDEFMIAEYLKQDPFIDVSESLKDNEFIQKISNADLSKPKGRGIFKKYFVEYIKDIKENRFNERISRSVFVNQLDINANIDGQYLSLKEDTFHSEENKLYFASKFKFLGKALGEEGDFLKKTIVKYAMITSGLKVGKNSFAEIIDTISVNQYNKFLKEASSYIDAGRHDLNDFKEQFLILNPELMKPIYKKGVSPFVSYIDAPVTIEFKSEENYLALNDEIIYERTPNGYEKRYVAKNALSNNYGVNLLSKYPILKNNDYGYYKGLNYLYKDAIKKNNPIMDSNGISLQIIKDSEGFTTKEQRSDFIPESTSNNIASSAIEYIKGMFNNNGEFVRTYFNESDKRKGYVNKTGVFINTARATLDTPFHEIGHIILFNFMKENDLDYNQAINLAKGHPMFDKIKRLYPEYNDNQVADEVIVELIGIEGAKKFETIDHGSKSFMERIRIAIISAIESFKKKLKKLTGKSFSINDSLGSFVHSLSDEIFKGTSSSYLSEEMINTLREQRDIKAPSTFKELMSFIGGKTDISKDRTLDIVTDSVIVSDFTTNSKFVFDGFEYSFSSQKLDEGQKRNEIKNKIKNVLNEQINKHTKNIEDFFSKSIEDQNSLINKSDADRFYYSNIEKIFPYFNPKTDKVFKINSLEAKNEGVFLDEFSDSNIIIRKQERTINGKVSYAFDIANITSHKLSTDKNEKNLAQNLFKGKLKNFISKSLGINIDSSYKTTLSMEVIYAAMNIKKTYPGSVISNLSVSRFRDYNGGTNIRVDFIHPANYIKNLVRISNLKELDNVLTPNLKSILRDENISDPSLYGDNYLHALLHNYKNNIPSTKNSQSNVIDRLQGFIDDVSNSKYKQLENAIMHRLKEIMNDPFNDQYHRDPEYLMLAKALYSLNRGGKSMYNDLSDMNVFERWVNVMNEQSNPFINWVFNKWNNKSFNLKKGYLSLMDNMITITNKLKKDHHNVSGDSIVALITKHEDIYYKDLFLYKDLKDENGGEHKVNTFMLINKNADPLRWARLSKAQKDFINDFNSEVRKLLKKAYKAKYKTSFEAAEKWVNDNYVEGMIPLVKGDVMSNLLKGNFKGGIGSMFDSFMNNAEYFNGEINTEYTEFPDMFLNQFGKGMYGTSVRAEMLGINQDTDIVDISQNSRMEADLKNVFAFYSMHVLKKEAMDDVIDTWRIAKAILMNQEDVTSKTQKNNINVMEDIIKANVFGEKIKLGDSAAERAANKALQAANTITTYGLLAFSPVSDAANFVGVTFGALVDATANLGTDRFSLGDLAFGMKQWVKNPKKLMKIMTEFQIINMDEMDLIHSEIWKGNKFKIISKETGFMGNFLGDYGVRAVILAAQMKKDGVYDAYSVKEVKKQDGRKALELVYDHNKEDRSKRPEGVSNKIRDNAIREGLQDEKDEKGNRLPLKTAYDGNYRRRVHVIINRALGAVNEDNIAPISTIALGKALFKMKTFMLPKITRAFKGELYNENMITYKQNGDIVEEHIPLERGIYSTMTRMLGQALYYKGNMNKLIKNADQRDKENIQQLASGLLYSLVVAIGYLALDDEEKDKRIIERLYNSAMHDLFVINNLSGLMASIKNPLISINYMSSVVDMFVEYLTFDLDEANKKAIKTIGLLKSIDNLNEAIN